MSFWTNRQAQSSHDAKEENPMSMMKRDDVPASAGPTGDLLLGAGAEFDGKLTFAGTVRIDAKFKGSISTNDVLVVGEHARIEADITCGTVIVYGEVIGNIKAKTAVELHHPAKMRGNVESPSLSIAKGVLFNGESRQPGTERAFDRSPPDKGGADKSAFDKGGADKGTSDKGPSEKGPSKPTGPVAATGTYGT